MCFLHNFNGGITMIKWDEVSALSIIPIAFLIIIATGLLFSYGLGNADGRIQGFCYDKYGVVVYPYAEIENIYDNRMNQMNLTKEIDCENIKYRR